MNPDRKNNTLPVEMDSINTKEIDLLITRTPFYLDTGWELVTENKNTSCSHTQIEQMIQKRTINLIDMEILKILAAYHYLNYYHVVYLLKERLHQYYHKTSYLDNLNKLKRAGLVLCYIPVRSGEMAGEHPLTPASPLRLYCLSQGAYAYMEPFTKDSHALPPSDSLRKIETAAANQFIIHFLHHYKDMQITIKWDIRSAEAERLFHSKRYEVPLLLRVNQFPSYLYRSSPDDRYDAYR